MLSKSEPLVSIIINCYNGEQYLHEALNSIVNQTYSNWELIFYDNLSIDRSAEIFRSIAKEDKRFFYHKAELHVTLMEARNQAIKFTNGEFIAFLDVDDLWTPDKLVLQVNEFNNHKTGIVCGNFYKLNEREGNISTKIMYDKLPSGNITNILLKDNFVHMSSLIFRAKTLSSLEIVFDPKFHIVGDLELLLRLNTKWELSSIQKPITYYRWHENNSGFKAGFLYSEELDLLLKDLLKRPEIISCQNFEFFKQRVYWLNTIRKLYSGKKFQALENFKYLSITNRFKIIISLLFPLKYIQNRVNKLAKNS